jgi:hypothetical protein
MITGRVMFFLLRLAFWLCLVCILLPSSNKPSSTDAKIDASAAVTAATAAVSDVRGFCERQPDACVTGGKVAVALGQKAEAGARTLYDFVTKLREKANSGDRTGSVPGTLTPSDLAPAWHAPVPLPPRRDTRDGRPAA